MKDEQKKYYLTFLGIFIIGLIVFSVASQATKNIYLLLVAASTAAAVMLIAKKLDNAASEFAPYSITVRPEMIKPLSEDYMLLRKDPDWDKFYGEAQEIRKEEGYETLLDGISFTVLQEYPRRIIYHEDRKHFTTDVDRREGLREKSFETKPEVGIGIRDFPQMYVKDGMGGYEVGITTPESSKKVIMAGDGNDEIEIINIPYSLEKEDLVKAGWTEDENTKSFREDVLFDVPFEYQSKYFTLSIRYI